MSRAKEAAGRKAVDLFVADGMSLGLGTGSTVYYALVRLADRITHEGIRIRGVPTSNDTDAKARGLGIPLATLDEVAALDLTIDGADEIDPGLHLIKGGGGALLREKVVASVSKRFVVVADRDKIVETLGIGFRLPVEIVPFARATVIRGITSLGAEPRLRTMDGLPYLTDNGNEILDCAFAGGIPDPASTERALAGIPGVVESGLFVGMTDVVVIGDSTGSCEVLERD
ncbi:MAG: ribose-5-phosphate isomerase RpiA [Acidobacteriota bacterium]|nr:ribose-5-phosphate isomerase RpiA [Acidobacteriota bacterium]